MPEALRLSLLAGVAFVAALLAAVTGFGGAAVLMPMLVLVFGVREAIPILTVAQRIGNGSRVWFNRHELDWRVVAWFALGGVPMALLGGFLFAHAPLPALTRVLGSFLILIVVIRHLPKLSSFKPPLKSFALIGAASSFLSALLGSVGPLMAPFFLAYGLVKGAYIGTEALSTVVMHVAKLIAYRESAVLPLHAIGSGLGTGADHGGRIIRRKASGGPAAGACVCGDHRHHAAGGGSAVPGRMEQALGLIAIWSRKFTRHPSFDWHTHSGYGIKTYVGECLCWICCTHYMRTETALEPPRCMFASALKLARLLPASRSALLHCDGPFGILA
jgi:uncharacterized protein